jgi:hypothetical protein
MKTVDDRTDYMTGFVIGKRKGSPSVKTTPEMVERGDKRRKIEQMQADKDLEEMIGDNYD